MEQVCVARELLKDEEWIQCLQEAAIMRTGYQLRRLFTIIPTECFLLHPFALWKQFSAHICDDLAYRICTKFGILNLTDDHIEDYGLYLMNQLLHESGKSLVDFPPMPQPIGNWNAIVGNRLLFENQQLENEAQQSDAQINVDCLNDAQLAGYTAVTMSVCENITTFFLNGGAGMGITFLNNTIATKLPSYGHVIVASSSIASLLLVGGALHIRHFVFL